jgi:hypothetical protein
LLANHPNRWNVSLPQRVTDTNDGELLGRRRFDARSYHTRSFQRRSHAELWMRQREAQIDRCDLPLTPRAHTLRGLLERYVETATPKNCGV